MLWPSSTDFSMIDWSSNSGAQVHFETDIAKFATRVDPIFADLHNTPCENVACVSPTAFVVDLS